VTPHGALELIPLYALDALPEAERGSVHEHLDSCPVCLDELGQYLAVTASLMPDQPAPSHVWPRIQAVIEAESGLSPTRTDAIDAETWRRRPKKLAFWAAGAVVAAAAVVIVMLGLASPQVTGADAILAAAEQAASEPGSYVGEFLVDEVSVARVILSPAGQGYLIPGERLPDLDSSRTYQLWVVNTEEAVISSGVLGNEPRPWAFTWVGSISGFALTREVAGGVTASAGDVVALATPR
jgi:hypothetical protein